MAQCRRCGEEFEPESRRIKYCCGRLTSAERQKQARDKQRDKDRDGYLANKRAENDRRKARMGDVEYKRDQKCRHLRREYGITLVEYESMRKEREGRCDICKLVPTTGNGKTLHVDHCHDTGKVRGLLCHGCNIGIGSLGDSVQLLRKAIRYLE